MTESLRPGIQVKKDGVRQGLVTALDLIGPGLSATVTNMVASISAGAGGPGGGGVAISAGASSQSTGTVVFAGSNGVTFGLNAGTLTASHNGYTGATTQFLTTAQPPGAYLTTAALSNHSHAFATTTTGGASVVVGTTNSNGVTIGVPAFLTTAANSTHSHGNPTLALTNLSGTTASASNGFTLSLSAGAGGAGDGGNVIAVPGTTNNSTGTVVFSNSNGVSFGLNAGTLTASHNGYTGATTQFLTTAANSTHSHGNPTLALTNLTGTTASASNGFTLSLSAAAPGAGGGIAVSAGTVAITSGTAVFSNANGVTFGANGQTVTASVNAGGGVTPPAYYAVPVWGQGSQSNALLTNITGISRRVLFMPFENIGNLTYNELHWPMSRSTSGSNNFSVFMGIYSYSNSSRLDSVFTTSGQFSGTNTASISGLRGFELTFASQSLSPGQYVMGLMFDPVGGNTASMNYSLMGFATGNTMLQTQVINGADQYHTNVNHLWLPFHGRYSVTTSALPASVPAASILAQGNATNIPLPMFWVLGTHYA